MRLTLRASDDRLQVLGEAWRDLLASIEEAPELVAAKLTRLAPELAALGVPQLALDAMDKGLRHGDWDDAVDSFGRCAALPVNFYVGPMSSIEGEAPRHGLLLSVRSEVALRASRRVEGLLGPIGRVLGFSCSFHGRRVEFFDLALAAGPFVNAGARHIALFTPFYLGGWHDVRRQALMRRTVLFLNLVRERFKAITLRAAREHLYIDGQRPRFLEASQAELDEAIALWLTLHELLHESGPLPLFRGPVAKLGLGMTYAPIEEARVDMSTWLLLKGAPRLFGAAGELAAEIILAERLLRSPRPLLNGLAPGDNARLDAEHGGIWLSHALNGGARIERGCLQVSSSELVRATRTLVQRIYDAEMRAVEAPERGVGVLREFASQLRAHLFGDERRTRVQEADVMLRNLSHLPSALEVCFGALAARG